METGPRERGTIHVAENPRFQRAEWAAQKVGSVLLVLLVLAALLGLFGRGLASSAVARSSDGAVQVEYERFGREGATWFLRVRSTSGGVGSLFLDKTLVEENEIEQIVPQPDNSRATTDGVAIAYDLPVTDIKLRLRPSGPGWFTYRIGAGPSVVQLRQLVYF